MRMAIMYLKIIMNSMFRIYLLCSSILIMSCSESRGDKLAFIKNFEKKYYKEITEVSNELKLLEIPDDFKLEFRKSYEIFFHTVDSTGRRGEYFYPGRASLFKKNKNFYYKTWLSSIWVKNGRFVIFSFGVFKRECVVVYFYDNITNYISKEKLEEYNENFLNDESDQWIVNGENKNIYFITTNTDVLHLFLSENK